MNPALRVFHFFLFALSFAYGPGVGAISPPPLCRRHTFGVTGAGRGRSGLKPRGALALKRIDDHSQRLVLAWFQTLSQDA